MPKKIDRTLNIRMKGDDVKALQEALTASGFVIGDKAGFFGKGTRRAVEKIQKRLGLSVTGIVEADLFDCLANPSVVSGRVTQPNGNPIAGARVRVLVKTVKEDVVLQEIKTGNEGIYKVNYLPVGGTASDLIVQIMDRNGEVVATSPLVIEAAKEQTVDLLVHHDAYPPETEFEELQKRLKSFLGDKNIAELDNEAVAYLAGKSRVNPVNISYLVQANRLAKETGIDAEAFYGMFRANLPVSLPALAVQDKETQSQAVEGAVAANIINRKVADQLDNVLDELAEQKVKQLLQKPDLPVGYASLGGLLEVSGITDNQKRAFAATYAIYNSTNQAFWDKLANDTDFDEEAANSVKLSIQLGSLTQNHVPLMQTLHRCLSQSGQGLRALVGRSEAEWLHDIRRHKDQNGNVILPPDLPEVDGQTPEETHARTMMRVIVDTFPTPAVAATLDVNDFVGARTVRDFINRHDFEFRDTNLRAFVRANNIALSDSERKDLFAFKRIFDVAPRFDRYNAMRPLLRDGVTSAYAIRKMGERGFQRTYGPEIGPAAAQQIYQAASQKSATASALFAANSPLLNNLGLRVIPQGDLAALLNQVQSIDLPTWESLFGGVTFCACEHCRSVYSPAAYLVDVLAFLRQRETDGKTALEVLFERRGDIGKIELNCHNTNTVLPYVDLVNEVLEHFLANAGVNSATDWWNSVEVPQTTGNPEDLRVHPENITAAAYNLLEVKDYPWTLPFSIWTEEMRAYLEPLHVRREEIMRLLNTHPEDALPNTVRDDIAAEHLGLITRERDIILGSVAGGADGWGGATEQELRQVETLTNKGRMSYYEVRRLLDTQTINPNDELAVEFPDDLCDLDAASIPKLQMTPHADKIQRFMRLQRKLGWEIYELDAAIGALSQGDLNLEILRRLAVVKQLHESLGTPLLTILSWWANINTARPKDEDDEERPSLYDRLFLNKTIGSDEDIQIFALNATRDELADTSQKIEDVKASILAALNLITAEELDLIIEKRQINDTLNLANLSELYRVASLSHALRLSVADLLYLIDLTGFDSFDLSNLEDLPHFFLNVLDLIKVSGFSIPELAYIVYHDFALARGFAAGDEATSDFLFGLRDGLKKINHAYQNVPDPTGERTAQMLAQVVPEAAMTEAMIVIAGVPVSEIPGALQNPIDRVAVVDNHFKEFIGDLRAVKEKLIEGINPAIYLTPAEKQTERFQIILDPLLVYLRRINSVALLKQSFADLLDIDLRASDQLVGDLIKAVSDTTLPASAEFLNSGFIESVQEELTEADFSNQYQVVRRLQKVATLLNKLDIPSDEVRWLVEESPQLGWLDLNALPVVNRDQNPPQFQAWLRMAQFTWLRQKLPDGEPSLFVLIRMAHTGKDEGGTQVNRDDFINHLHAGTGWNKVDIETLLNANHFNLVFNSDLAGEKALKQLARLYHSFKLLKHLGVSAEMPWNWAMPTASRAMANEVKQAARAKFDENTWLSVAEPIRDALRLKQRTALVDAALEIVKQNHSHIEEAEDLFGFFLMDVEMNPCMLTSRIKQAISSVQLFVQRCLMNLEKDVILDAEAAEQWKWMKNYRVWEANRKIFLYPENYIEPELRPEKSPFFVDLENALLQNDVTKDTAELALLNYLEKLDEVARLEVASVYNDEETKTLHVLGRTKGIPNKYFYRRWEKRRRWTPWDPVAVDIEGKNVAITHYNRRLYLFWFMVQEKADDSDNLTSTVPKASATQNEGFPTQRPFKYLQIKLAWSQYHSGKWLPKRISNVAVQTEPMPFTLHPKEFSPRPLIQNDKGELLVAVELIENLTGSIRFNILNSAVIPDEPAFIFTSEDRVSLGYYEGPQERDILLNLPAKDSKDGKNTERPPIKGHLYIRARDRDYAKILENAPPYRVVVPVQYTDFLSQASLFYEDSDRCYLIVPRGGITLPEAPGGLVADPVLHGTRPKPDEPFRPPFGNPGVIDPPIVDRFSDLVFGDMARPRTSIVSGVDSIGSSLMSANALVASNIYGTELATHVVGETASVGSTNTGSGFFSNFLPSVTQPSASTAVRDIVQPFVMDQMSLLGADAVLTTGAENRWANILHYLETKFRFHIFYHPYVDFLIKQLNRYGIDGMLNPIEGGEADDLRRQQKRESAAEAFDQIYELGDSADKGNLPIEEFDFTYTGAFATYNWELFFHAPLLIAVRLSANQQFEAAQKWFHYIFDPTDVSALPQKEDRDHRFWKIKPFFENREIDNIRRLLQLLGSDDPQVQAKREALEAQIADWRENPFQPHLIAQQRVAAYQRTTVMKYIDNLIAWGDYLFRRDTIESINEATQLYVLAAQILGKKPEAVSAPDGKVEVDGKPIKTFDDLAPHLDAFGNALVQIESELPASPEPTVAPYGEAPTADIVGATLFFCIPRNNKLLRHWDTVADRLFKIRNCMNVEGVVRQLSLFEPPIDPGLLVRAAEAGIDLSSVLNDMNAPRLHYRYSVLVQKAIELCNDVKQLGGALLAALEKRDAEKLTLLRSGHEERLLRAIKSVRELQLKEAEESLAGLEKNLETVQARQRFYAERESRIPNEKLQLDKLDAANTKEEIAQGIMAVKAALIYFPQLNSGVSGFGGSPQITTSFGGIQLGGAMDAASQILSFLALLDRNASNRTSIVAGFDRRQEEWDFQAGQAATEIEALEKQIEGAGLRIAIAEHEMDNQELQIEQNRELDEFMRMKFSNQELYGWMTAQISTIYFQSYQLAYDMARRAQRAYQYELADYEISFIEFGYWDNLKKGLLAGERLHYDLRRMESTYFEANRREYELTKHISLILLNPAALVQLRETGSCEIDIPEVVFDIDYPGHFLRRIKSFSLSIPCVTGPYTTVNCTLTLLNNRIRSSTDNPNNPYTGLDDTRFISNVGGAQSIATSTAREDSGLFEFNFRDERYLPFEGTGAVGRWQLELPTEYRQFDYDTIADVVLHMRYTAREGGAAFKAAIEQQIDSAVNELVDAVNQKGLFQFISMKYEFGTAFNKFLNPVGVAEHETTITLSTKHFPFLFHRKNINIQNVIVFIKLRDASLYNNNNPLALSISRDGGSHHSESLVTAGDELGGLAHAAYSQLSGGFTDDEDWEFTVKDADVQNIPSALRHTVNINGASVERIKTGEVEDFGILLQYEVS